MQNSADQVSAPLRFSTNLGLLFGLTLMVVMGVSSITPAFPRMMNELGLSKGEVGLLITFYSLPGVLFALPIGISADRIGRKKILVPFLILFGVAGAACAFTGDLKTLLVLRFLQGTGATAAGTLNPTILGDLYNGTRRTLAMSYNVGVLNIGTAGFPVIGGALAMFGWQYPFLLPLTAIPLGIAILLFLKTPEHRNVLNNTQYLRAALASVSNRKALGMFIITLITFIVLYGSYLTFLPLLIGMRFGSVSLVIGLIMSVTSLSSLLTTSRMSWFIERYSKRNLMLAGFICYAISMLIFPFVTVIWFFIIPTVIYGFGTGINMPSAQSILMGLAPDDARAGFLSINSMVLRIGQTLGPLIMGLVVTFWSIEGVFITGAIFSAMMLVSTAILIE